MKGRNPNAVTDADQETMQEKFPGTIPGDQVRTNNKNENPEERFEIGRDPIYCGNGHGQPEQGKLKDQFPVHKSCFWMSNRCE